MNKIYSNAQIISYLRIMNGISLVIYYLMVIFPFWNNLFSVSSGIVPDLFSYYPKSPLFLIWNNDLLKLIITIVTFFSILMYTTGIFARTFQIIGLLGHLSLHLANPFLIHEPQQLNNLLFLMMLFLPIGNSYKKTNNINIEQFNTRYLLLFMQLYIGIYYFFAAIKKVPDLNWLNGSAVGLICSWTYLQKNNLLNQICQNEYISIFLTYLTLLFELLFLPISFTKYKKYLIFVGLILHAGIGLSLNEGLFFWSMIMWYPLLLKRKD